ncbi:MAG TPA: KR domain-containing protein [Roseiflexaceae bacterium]|jgi:nucleoside-diphosphate-sugar epimerase|nr:KR domain-containing protein [Roseiflexaceae bacterium]
MKLLVTGAHGFVGVNLVRWLAATLPDATIVAADLQPPDALTTAFLAPVAARVQHATLDVTDRAALARLAAELHTRLGPAPRRLRDAPPPLGFRSRGEGKRVR